MDRLKYINTSHCTVPTVKEIAMYSTYHFWLLKNKEKVF